MRSSPAPVRSVFQVIPSRSVGGVELAARSVRDNNAAGISFEILEVENRKDIFRIFEAISEGRKEKNEQIVVFSLWKSAILAAGVAVFFPRVVRVFFVHSSRDSHFLDFLLTRLGVLFAREVWFDSESSRANRLGPLLLAKKPLRVICGRTNLLEPLPLVAPRVNFIFWGRLSAEKNLSEAINFVHNLMSESPQANFTIVGPDCGELNRLERQVVSLGLSGNVTFVGPRTIAQIVALAKGASFYLQTSSREGLSQSVLEAMSLGLVPIVTPVGEIGNYCRAGENAILIGQPSKAKQEVLSVVNNPAEFDMLRATAISTAAEFPKFSDEFLSACREAMSNFGSDE